MTLRFSPWLTSRASRQRAFLISGGQDPGPAFIQSALAHFPQAPVLAADRGAQFCLKAGRPPDMVLGDMDSISAHARASLKKAQVPQETFAVKKDDTDTALALDLLMRQGVQEIIVLAGLGSRWDHSLANLALASDAYRQGVDLVFWDADNRARLIGPGDYDLEAAPAFYFSLIPWSSQDLTLSLTGFEYPLDQAHVPQGPSLLVSNRWTDPVGKIHLQQGQALICVSRDKEC